MDWTKEHFPKVQVHLTDYDPQLGAEGVFFETEDLDIYQALELLAMREEMSIPIGLLNLDKLSKVSFNVLFPHPKSIKF